VCSFLSWFLKFDVAANGVFDEQFVCPNAGWLRSSFGTVERCLSLDVWLPTCCEDSLVFKVRVGDALSEVRSTELGVRLMLTPLGCRSRDVVRIYRLVLGELPSVS
jgi:hypothetical protein